MGYDLQYCFDLTDIKWVKKLCMFYYHIHYLLHEQEREDTASEKVQIKGA